MISVQRTWDFHEIKFVVTHPKVYPHVTDDSSPRPEDYSPPDPNFVWYLLVKDDRETLGIFALVPQNSVCFEVHTCLLPNAYGQRARLAAVAAIGWMAAHSPCKRVITNVPEDNRIALRFATRVGMKEFGINEKSFLKDGKLLDQHVLGITLCH